MTTILSFLALCTMCTAISMEHPSSLINIPHPPKIEAPKPPSHHLGTAEGV